MQSNVYLDLTQALNTGRLRVILSSGQAVVLHRLAVMSKDGDWILREDEEALRHALTVLETRYAHYRFGAPLDVRWMAGGWSSHFEFRTELLRVRTDFVTRPPRVTAEALSAAWRRAENQRDGIPFVDATVLAELKKTNRDKDYAVIGELARLIDDPAQQMLLSRSARDLKTLARDYPHLRADLSDRRPLLRLVHEETAVLEAALDAERRSLIHANERRLQAYAEAAERWAAAWPAVADATAGLPLPEAHELIVQRAEGVLPFRVEVLAP